MLAGRRINNLLHYSTNKIIILPEKKFGACYTLLSLLLFFFVIIYNVLIQEGHKIFTNGTGSIFPKVDGKLMLIGRNKTQIMDAGDYLVPYDESDSLFIATEIYNIPKQILGYCGKVCTLASDCPVDPPLSQPSCLANHRCMELKWCPEVSATREFYVLTGVPELQVYILGTMEYPGVTDHIFKSTLYKHKIPFPDVNANTYTVRDLLNLANVKFEDVTEKGGNFKILMQWECETSEKHCKPRLSVKPMSITNKLNPLEKDISAYKEKIVSFKDGIYNAREYSLIVGLRFYLESEGIGKTFSLYELFRQLSMYLALLMVVRVLMDFFFFNFYGSSNLRREYKKFKYIDSDDFTDLKEGLIPVKKEREAQIKAKGGRFGD